MNNTANTPDASPSSARSRSRRRPRRLHPMLVPRRVRGRRGIILIFVVVLLVLLAIMGTAYLAVSRLDRQAMTGRGSMQPAAAPRLNDVSTLDALHLSMQQHLKREIIRDLFNVTPAETTETLAAGPRFAKFRQVTTGTTYENFDAPGAADPWLSSLLPQFDSRGTVERPFWPIISAPSLEPNGTSVGANLRLENFFSDPRELTRATGFATAWRYGTPAAYADRTRVYPAAVSMLRDPVAPLTKSGFTPAHNTRVYPGFVIRDPTAGTPAVIAGDADGDGIADSGLIPLVVNPNVPTTSSDLVERYLDRVNNVVYFVSYRIVDNSAMVNASTALSLKGDFADPTINSNPVPTADPSTDPSLNPGTNSETRNLITANLPNSPNFGFFRSNVGLVELVHQTLEPYGPLTNTGRPAQLEVRRLVDGRFPYLQKNPNGTATDVRWLVSETAEPAPVPPATRKTPRGLMHFGDISDTPASQTPPSGSYAEYQYLSWGDLAEQQLTRRSLNPGPIAWGGTVATDALVPLPIGDAVSWRAGGGTMLNPLLAPGIGEDALLFTTRFGAVNYTGGGEPWRWFPPGDVMTWFRWAADFEPPHDYTSGNTTGPISLLDGGANTRTFTFNTTTDPVGPGMAKDVQMIKPLRALLTSYSGVTSASPERGTYAAAVTPNTPGVTTPWSGMPGYGTGPNQYPATRVSAATGTKEQLWRAYWSAMTHQVGAGDWAADTEGDFTTGPVTDPVFDAFKSIDRHPSASNGIESLDTKSVALIRAAVAACNTIDVRDADQDITAMTVRLPAATGATGTTYAARVYGTEKQLVITGVVINDDDGIQGTGPTYVAVELYNPSDEVIDLRAYQLAVVLRNPGTTNPVLEGMVEWEPTAAAAGALQLATDYTPIAPGGFVVITTDPATPAGITIQPAAPASPSTPAKGGPPKTSGQRPKGGVTHVGPPDPAAVSSLTALVTAQDRELVLLRTRRADGEAYTDATASNPPTPFNAPMETALRNEVLTQPLTLVPVDGVDCRSINFDTSGNTTGNLGKRAVYLRAVETVDPLGPGATYTDAWRCFYAGEFYTLRPAGAGSDRAPTGPAPADYAWNVYPAGTILHSAATVTLGLPRPYAPTASGGTVTATPATLRAPAIQIQNFKPYDPRNATPYQAEDQTVPIPGGSFPINKFPYGSPFARNGDIVNAVPFIGSYKIYRQTGTAVPVLYEYVPLPMDAWTVASNPTECEINPSVGRFDPSRTIATTPGGVARADRLPTNDWAIDLFDYVTARQAPSRMFFPDVPDMRRPVPDPSNGQIPYELQQDGPVKGSETTLNANNSVIYTSWASYGGSAAVAATPYGQSVDPGGDKVSQLIQGTINVNTAPQIVLRMLPWAVAPGSGYVVLNPTTPTPEQLDIQDVAETLSNHLYRGPTAPFPGITTPGPQGTVTVGAPSYDGIASVQSLTDINYVSLSGVTPLPANDDEAIRMGMLNPKKRPPVAVDQQMHSLNMNRVSNLVSTRSDVFTVYVTVQAWTWVGDNAAANQRTDTRLVGERRSAFIVDRSRINHERYKPEDLIVTPIEQE